MDISQFSIYRNSSPDQKRQTEALDLMPFLLRVGAFIKFTDVQFGEDPPDFVFHHQDGTIGVELTDLNPKIFEKNGHLRRADFKSFNEKIGQKNSAHEAFNWGKYSLRESLDAFSVRLKDKRSKAKSWFANFPERCLLMHVASGSPFGEILGGTQEITPGLENEVADYFAKVTHAVHTICQEASPFDFVILFRESENTSNMLTFSPSRLNPYKLPMPQDEILNRGAKA